MMRNDALGSISNEKRITCYDYRTQPVPEVSTIIGRGEGKKKKKNVGEKKLVGIK